MQQPAISLDAPSGRFALALAAAMRRPLDVLTPAGTDAVLQAYAARTNGLGRLDTAPALAELAASPVGRNALNRALVSGGLGAALAPDLQDLDRLAAHTDIGRVLAVALAPAARLEALVRLVGAAIFAGRLRGLLLRTERAAARALFGSAAFDFALLESQPFYAALVGLGSDADLGETGDFAGTEAGQRACEVLAAAVGRVEPLAARLVTFRLSGRSAPPATPADLTSIQARQLDRLIDRKGGLA